jgi:hypothetical protein
MEWWRLRVVLQDTCTSFVALPAAHASALVERGTVRCGILLDLRDASRQTQIYLGWNGDALGARRGAADANAIGIDRGTAELHGILDGQEVETWAAPPIARAFYILPSQR